MTRQEGKRENDLYGSAIMREGNRKNVEESKVPSEIGGLKHMACLSHAQACQHYLVPPDDMQVIGFEL